MTMDEKEPIIANESCVLSDECKPVSLKLEDDIDPIICSTSECAEEKESLFPSRNVVVGHCWKSTSGEGTLTDVLENGRNAEDRDDRKSEGENVEAEEGKDIGRLGEVEDAIMKSGNKKFEDRFQIAQGQGRMQETPCCTSNEVSESFFGRKYFFSWAIIKAVEMIICHVIQVILVSNDHFHRNKKEFLPFVVTYYFTLFMVVISLLVHVVCSGCLGVHNPFYFMGIVTASTLTLTTSLGMLVLLCTMAHYQSAEEVLVFAFVVALLVTLLMELAVCYVEIKKFWRGSGRSDSYEP